MAAALLTAMAMFGAAPECAVASGYLRSMDPARGPVVLSSRDRADTARDVPLARQAQYWRNEAPSDDLARRYDAARFENLTTRCPDAAALAPHLRISLDVRKTVDLQTIWRRNGHGTLLTLGTPVFSADGRHALMPVESVCGFECGSGHLMHLRLGNDGWTVVGRLDLWIS